MAVTGLDAQANGTKVNQAMIKRDDFVHFYIQQATEPGKHPAREVDVGEFTTPDEWQRHSLGVNQNNSKRMAWLCRIIPAPNDRI